MGDLLTRLDARREFLRSQVERPRRPPLAQQPANDAL